MKKFHVVLFFLLISGISIGQAPGFNLVIDAGYPKNHLRDLIVHNDTIVGYGIGFDDTIQWNQGVFLVQFDSSGNLLNSTLVLDSLGDKLAIDRHWGKVVSTSDGGYAMTAAAFFRESAFLIKMDANLQVEFIKEYEDTVNVSNFSYRILEVENGYFLFGNIQRPNLFLDGFIRRVDDSGEVIWNQYFGDANADNGILDIKKLSDSTFIVGSVDGVGPNSSRTTLRIIDLDGNVLETWASAPEPEIGYLRKLLVNDDGSLIVYGLAVVDVVMGTKVVQPTFSKFSPGLELEWVYHYGRTGSLSALRTFHDLEHTLDGSYIAAGESSIYLPNDPDLSSGWMMKVSPDGDSLWGRYDLAPFPEHYTNDHFFGGVGVLSSGNIVAGGSASEGNERYIWLVKVTPDGCLDTLFCQPITSLFEEQKAELGVKVFPNPATRHFSLQASFPVRQVRLLDVTGREVRQWPTTGAFAEQEKFELPTGLPPGIYFVSVQSEDGRVLSEKLLVE